MGHTACSNRVTGFFRHFLRHTWISRIPLWNWLGAARRTFSSQQSALPIRPRTCRPFLEQLEELVLPNDPFGVLQMSLLGASCAQMTPGNVIAQGWGIVSNPAPADRTPLASMATFVTDATATPRESEPIDLFA